MVQFAFVVVARNSIGGVVARVVPVGYSGRRLPPLVFIGRDYLVLVWLAVASLVGQIVTLPGTHLLAAVFGDVPVFTSDYRGDNGLYIRSSLEWLPGIALLAWMFRDARRGPYFQTITDRVVRTVVVRASSLR